MTTTNFLNYHNINIIEMDIVECETRYLAAMRERRRGNCYVSL